MSKEIKISDKYESLYNEDCELYIITGERGSSKSFTVADYLTRKTFQSNQVIYFTRYTLDSAKDSIIPEFNEKIDLLNATEFFDIKRLDIINNYSQSEIKFRGIKASSGSQTAKLKSLHGASVWVIDEAEELIDENIYDKLDASLRQKNQKNIKIIIMNPTYKKHWIYKRYFKNTGVKEDFNGIKDDVCYINMLWEDNTENLPDKWIKEAEKLKKENPKKYKKKYTTGWLNPEDGLLFPEFQTYVLPQISEIRSGIKIAYIDTADKGKDFYAMPIVELIDNKAYLLDVIYSQMPLTVTKPLTIEKINTHNVLDVVIESNKEGSLYVSNIQDACKNAIVRGLHNTTKKETRILSQSEWLLKNLIVRSDVSKDSEYYKYIESVLEYEINPAEKQFDDAPDSLAGLAKFIRVYM